MGKALVIVALVGAAVLWYFSSKTQPNFERFAAMRRAGGHSILKPDAPPQPIQIVGSWLPVEGESPRTVMIKGRAENCDSSVPGCFLADQLMMIHNPDSEQIRAHPPFYRGTHYFLGTGQLRTDGVAGSRTIQHYGSLAEARDKR